MNKSILVILTSALFVFSSCQNLFDDRTGKAKDLLQKQIESDSKYIKINDFDKIDGQIKNFLGQEIYNLEFDMEIEYTKEANVYYNQFRPLYSANFNTYEGDDMPDHLIPLSKYTFAKGQKLRMKGEVYFTKKESGWQPENYTILHFKIDEK